MKGFMNKILKLIALVLLLSLVSCSGGSSPGGGSKQPDEDNTAGGVNNPEDGWGTGAASKSSYDVQRFLGALSTLDNSHYSSTRFHFLPFETERTKVAGQDEWFLIFDGKDLEYKAVNLDYIRSIVYYDTETYYDRMAAEFRGIEARNISNGNLNGDIYGNQYEIADVQSSGRYKGRQSDYMYEDEMSSTDVSLMSKEQEQNKFLSKAAKISFTLNVSIEASMTLVTLGSKLERMLSRANGELTQQDQLAIMSDMQTLTGVTLLEIQEAATNSDVREDVIAKIAKKLGTTTLNLEQKILPDVFGIVL